MKKKNFPVIAAVLGIALLVIALQGSKVTEEGGRLMPLLTLLLICEFGAVITAIGAFLGYQHFPKVNTFSGHAALVVFCLFLCALFIIKGFSLWPH